MALANSFAPIASNTFSRKWGGSQADAVDPYVSGYFFTHWSYLPPQLGPAINVAGGPDGITGTGEAQDVLKSSCLSVTIPGGTVNKAEFTGLGGTKWSVPTNVEFDNTVTVKFLEFSSLPILAIIHGWVRLIRDYRSGIAETLSGGDNYTKSAYSGTMYYWTTKPDGQTIEYYSCMSGMFPLKDPTDQYGGDLTTYDKLEIDIDFNVDYVWHEDWVKTRCDSLAEKVKGTHTGTTLGSYGEGEPAE